MWHKGVSASEQLNSQMPPNHMIPVSLKIGSTFWRKKQRSPMQLLQCCKFICTSSRSTVLILKASTCGPALRLSPLFVARPKAPMVAPISRAFILTWTQCYPMQCCMLLVPTEASQPSLSEERISEGHIYILYIDSKPRTDAKKWVTFDMYLQVCLHLCFRKPGQLEVVA